MKVRSIDIFCQVIDNFGDVGVCYRLYKELSYLYSKEVTLRLIIDRVEEFFAICSTPEEVCYRSYEELEKEFSSNKERKTADLIIEAFGCKLPDWYLEKAYIESKCILNLEYFSAEEWTKDFHLQESVLGRGSCRKFFYMPGISKNTGGILTGKYFPELSWTDFGLSREDYDWVGSIFSYEKDFTSLVESLRKTGKKVCLCILGEKSQGSIRKSLGNFVEYDKIHLEFLPFYSQEKYEALLQLCDFNFVRGEDSFARALLMGKPFLWHIYRQEGKLHLQKLESFLKQYCPENEELQDVFMKYNADKTDYRYFFDNLSQIQKHNETFRTYMEENCNLGIKLKQFIENF